jgi:RecA-family ATPase
MLAGEGGVGKTLAMFDLAVAVATGGDWLGRFRPDEPGRVLLLLGEEDEAETRRRLHHATLDAGPPEGWASRVAQVTRNVVAVPLAGRADLALAGSLSNDGDRTLAAVELHGHVKAEAEAGRPFALIVIDPLARFAGLDAEKDNAMATRFMQVVESLAAPDLGDGTSGPTVLVVHHTAKATSEAQTSRKARGVGGLTDAARWLATLTNTDDPDVVVFAVDKANWSRRPAPYHLRKGDHGRLRAETPGEVLEREAARKNKPTTPGKASPRKRADLDDLDDGG